MEDCANKDDPVALATFQHHYITHQPQVDPLFDRFTAHINKLWEYYHPIGANAAVSGLVDFASACYLEIMTEGMKVNPGAAHYPDYIRGKTGIADFYTFGLWPVAQFPDIRAYVQAVPAISRFTSKFGLTSSRLSLTFQQTLLMTSLASIKKSFPERQ